MSGEIEATPEIRQQYARENAESLARLGLNPDHVEPWEDGYRSAKEKDVAFEWWYFDAHLDDGSALVITFDTKPMTSPSGPLAPSLMLMYRPAGGERHKSVVRFPAGEFEASTDGCNVHLGPNYVRGDLRHYTLHAEADGITIDLEMESRAPPWRPGAAISYYNKEMTQYFAWVVPVPYGTFEGKMTKDGKVQPIRGTMYHDHNWGTATLGNSLDYWYWGRAHVGEFTIIYVQMVTGKLFGHGGFKLPVFYLSTGDRILTEDGLPLRLETSGEVEGPGGQTYPTKLEWTWRAEESSVRFVLTNPKLNESFDMTEDMPGWARPLIHLVANPYYYNFAADIELDVDLGGVKAHRKGSAIFEKMMFR